jgi:nucleoside-diphosphate-sugar epimerase
LKVLVTGSEGFVGKHLCRQLVEEGATVVKDSLVKNIALRMPKSHIVGVDVLIHLAARASAFDSANNPYETYSTNILSTLWALETARLNHISKFIYINSYIYGQPEYLPVDEKHKINPETPYHKSKYIGEKLCEYYFSDFGINIVTLRTFTLYGPGAKSFQSISRLINQIHHYGNAILSTDSMRRDFLYVEDFVRLVSIIVRQFPIGYSTYNVGAGKSFELIKVAKLIAKLMNKHIDIIIDKNMFPNKILNVVADISKVKKEYDWMPIVEMDEGLRVTINDYQKMQNYHL